MSKTVTVVVLRPLMFRGQRQEKRETLHVTPLCRPGTSARTVAKPGGLRSASTVLRSQYDPTMTTPCPGLCV